MCDAHSVVLPVRWIGKENMVEPNGWVDKRYLDPTFSLLPVKPPEINTLSLPCTKNYLKPVGHELKTVIILSQHIIMEDIKDRRNKNP